MVLANDTYNDIRRIICSDLPINEKYRELYGILSRICSQETMKSDTDFSGLFSRLYAVCQNAGIDHHDIDAFRRHARRIMNGEEACDANAGAPFRDDYHRLCLFISQLYNIPLPEDLKGTEGTATPTRKHAYKKGHRINKLRAIIVNVGKEAFSCTSNHGDLLIHVPHLSRTLCILSPGMPVNILGVEFEDDEKRTAEMVIIDPDYLIDVSALSACMKPYGDSAESYFLDMISPKETTIPIMLGNAANRFMDDLVNTPVDFNDNEAVNQLYEESLHKHFMENMLNYSCLDLPLDKSYFDTLKETFRNIKSSVQHRFPSAEVGLPLEDTLLEPSFICETLGLRGRLDVMAANHKSLVELKSGKAEENYGHSQGPQRQHVMQMSLYKEMLHYNFSMPRDNVKSFLFYSRYPVFYNQRSASEAMTEALELRNEIVVMEARIRKGELGEMLENISSDALNKNGLSNSLWNKYIRPQLENVIRPLHTMSPLEHDYFTEFATFLEREKYLSKTSDNRPDSNRALASTWATDLKTKLASGDILPNLKIKSTDGEDGIECITFIIPHYGNDFIANFSVGEMVQMYKRNSNRDTVISSQLIRGYIEHLNDKEVTLRLSYKQRNKKLFPQDACYAIEHDGSDTPFASAMRGLYSLLTAPEERRNLLLGQRLPKTSRQERPLRGHWENEKTTEIIQKVKNADDYHLLVGPPGTGKTSVALRAMVEEFLLEKENTENNFGLMLMAYTNRAVDEICTMLDGIKASYVRIGGEQTCAEEHRDHLLTRLFADTPRRSDVVRKLQTIPIVVGTVSTLSNHLELFRLRPYHAIIDEASQVLEPQILGLLCAKDAQGLSAIRKFVMIGDHKQLPAVVLLQPGQTVTRSPRLHAIGLTDMRNSLFQRLHALACTNRQDEIVSMLDRQGRMHPDICNFVNNAFYQGRLQAVPLPHQQCLLPTSTSHDSFSQLVDTERMVFINVQPAVMPRNAKANYEEAAVVAKIIKRLVDNNEETPCFLQHIGIIVPFRNQISVIRNALCALNIPNTDKITIDTVECFQGSQRDYIIFSTTVSRPYQMDILSTPTEIEGQTVDRKLNVAITRARLQFFMVGNAKLLASNAVYKSLIDSMKRFNK